MAVATRKPKARQRTEQAHPEVQQRSVFDMKDVVRGVKERLEGRGVKAGEDRHEQAVGFLAGKANDLTRTGKDDPQYRENQRTLSELRRMQGDVMRAKAKEAGYKTQEGRQALNNAVGFYQAANDQERQFQEGSPGKKVDPQLRVNVKATNAMGICNHHLGNHDQAEREFNLASKANLAEIQKIQQQMKALQQSQSKEFDKAVADNITDESKGGDQIDAMTDEMKVLQEHRDTRIKRQRYYDNNAAVKMDQRGDHDGAAERIGLASNGLGDTVTPESSKEEAIIIINNAKIKGKRQDVAAGRQTSDKVLTARPIQDQQQKRFIGGDQKAQIDSLMDDTKYAWGDGVRDSNKIQAKLEDGCRIDAKKEYTVGQGGDRRQVNIRSHMVGGTESRATHEMTVTAADGSKQEYLLKDRGRLLGRQVMKKVKEGETEVYKPVTDSKEKKAARALFKESWKEGITTELDTRQIAHDPAQCVRVRETLGEPAEVYHATKVDYHTVQTKSGPQGRISADFSIGHQIENHENQFVTAVPPSAFQEVTKTPKQQKTKAQTPQPTEAPTRERRAPDPNQARNPKERRMIEALLEEDRQQETDRQLAPTQTKQTGPLTETKQAKEGKTEILGTRLIDKDGQVVYETGVYAKKQAPALEGTAQTPALEHTAQADQATQEPAQADQGTTPPATNAPVATAEGAQERQLNQVLLSENKLIYKYSDGKAQMVTGEEQVADKLSELGEQIKKQLEGKEPGMEKKDEMRYQEEDLRVIVYGEDNIEKFKRLIE